MRTFKNDDVISKGGNTKLVAHFDSIVVISSVLERGSKAGVDFVRRQ
jgi:hypothetical protein